MTGQATKTPTRVMLDDLLIDYERRQVFRGKQRLAMPSLSFSTLSVLVQHAPETVSIQSLIDQAWGGAVVADETVTQRIKLIRGVLGDNGRVPRYIDTVRGQGYRLIPKVIDASASGSRTYTLTGLALAAIIMLGLAFVFFAMPRWQTGPLPEQTVASTPTADDFIQQASVYATRHQRADNQLAIDLYRQALQLEPLNTAAKTGLSLSLSQRVTKFDGGDDDINEAQQLAEELTGIRADHADSWLALGASQDARGQILQAIRSYERVLQLDPDHNSAAASLAYLYQINGRLLEALQRNLEALPAADRLPYLNLQIGTTLMLLGFDPAAEPWLRRTDQLQPDNVFAAETLAHFLLVNQRFEDAETVLESALARGLNRSALRLQLGLIYQLQDNVRQADSVFQQLQRSDPDHHQVKHWLTVHRAQQHALSPSEYEAQINHMQHIIANGDTWPTNYLELARLHAAFGERERAIEALEQSYQAGFRDHRLLRLLPSFTALRATPEFQDILNRIEQDLTAQRNQVLSAEWVPRALLFAQR